MKVQNLIIPEYQFKEELFRSDRTVIYRAMREKDQTEVVIKALNNEYPSNHEIALFQHESLITKKMARGQEGLPGVIHAYDQIKSGNSLALILKNFHGLALRDYLTHEGSVKLKLFLQLAIDISKSLGHIHQQHVIHKDINPSNILFNRDTKKSQIIDFGIATELSTEMQDVNVMNKLEGSLAYISPEQTGRMNREIDYRTDYYSLGITFYEMLTGSLPFNAEDPIGWIHCHIAKTPPSPHDLDHAVPEVVSNILMQLMSKNAEDRYQSSVGIVRDLEECLNRLEQHDQKTAPTIDNFELGRWDIPEKFQIPQKLLGREKELETITKAFENIAQGGCEYLVVSGYSGVGKSALVHEVHKPIVRQKGYFIDGKFDQFQRDVPYSAFIQSFRGLVNQLLTETDENLDRWKTLLLEAIHPNGQIIIEVIPEVEKIIGQQAHVQKLNSTEAQNRFFITFKNFIQVFAQKEHPLVIFLDDLQWSDIPTLTLIEHLITSKEMSYLLLIGAFRDNEVKEGHPLKISLDDIQKTTPIRLLFLQPLREPNVNHLVSETVQCDLKTAAPLSSLVFDKTHGNPFFVIVLLKNLYREGIFTYHGNEGQWDWDLGKISAMNVTENVVEFMIQRLKKLQHDTQNTLQFAACVGNLFDLKTLALIHEQSLSAISEILLPAIQEGIIVPLNDQYRLVHLQSNGHPESNREESDFGVSYKFQHDRVQQAAYSLLEENAKKGLHLKIARLLKKHTPDENLEEKLIEIVRHFNEGKGQIVDAKERENVSLLNLRAGKKAKKSNAYRPAFEYLKIAKELLPGKPWSTSYDRCFEIHKEYADAAYLSGELETAEQTGKILLNEAKTKLEKVMICRMQVLQYTLLGRLEDAIQSGILALSLLGMKVSMEPGQFTVLKEVLMAKWNLGRRSVESLIYQPLLEDPEKKIAMKILIELAPPAYLLGLENLFAVVVLKQVNLSLRFGNSPEAAYAYSVYAVLLNGALGDFKSSHEFGKLAVKLNEKLDDLEFRCRILFIYTTFVHCWNHHWKTTFPIYKKTMEVGLQTGDLLYIGYTTIWILKLNSDLTLNEVAKLAEGYLAIALSSKHQDSIDIGNIYQQYRLNLMGKTKDQFTLSDSGFDEDECLTRMLQSNFMNGIATLLATKLQIYYLNEAFEEGIKLIRKADKVIKALLGLPFTMEYCFYVFMAHAAAYPKMNEKEKLQALKRMKKEYKQMRKWHGHYPVNSFHFVFMMDAESARISGDPQAAISSLEKAIDAATKNGFLQYKAMANEVLGKLYITLNKKKIAGIYMADAYYDYQIWGATSKLDFLKEHYEQYIDLKSSQTIAGTANYQSTLGTTYEREPDVDMSTASKAAQTISSEVVLEKLLKKLIEIVRENAGAEKAILLLSKGKDRELLIQAKSLGREEVEVLTAEKPEASSQISLGIINYVARSLEYVLLGEATQEGNFISDPYIEKYRPKSVLSMPILNQGKLIGVLYLENNIASFAFTPNHLEILTMLSAQAAISINNALLYENLEEHSQLMEQQKEEIENAYTQLKELEEFKEAMTGMIVHDFKNALNTVISFSEGVPSERRLKSIRQAGRHMLDMVLNLLDVQKFEKASINLTLTIDPINKVIKEALERVSFLIEQKSIKLVLQLDNDSFSLFDFKLISRVIINILTNAIKYTQANGSIHIQAEKQEGLIKLSIRDTGQGIPADKLHLVFDKFFSQVQDEKDEDSRSTGLGLAFCKMVVEAHGGEIGVESTEGQGSNFYFTLPRTEPIEEQKPTIEKISIQEDPSIMLSKEEKDLLIPYLKELQQWEVYDYSEVTAILEKVNTGTSNINMWKERVIDALHNVNEEKYSKLINL